MVFQRLIRASPAKPWAQADPEARAADAGARLAWSVRRAKWPPEQMKTDAPLHSGWRRCKLGDNATLSRTGTARGPIQPPTEGRHVYEAAVYVDKILRGATCPWCSRPNSNSSSTSH